MSRLRRFIARACKPHSLQRSKKSVLYSADYDTSHPIETRKYLRTYGLTPPGVDSFEIQSKRCERYFEWNRWTILTWSGMAILNSRKTDIEKYQYLSVLRNTNVHLFYRLLSDNIKVGHIRLRYGSGQSDKQVGAHSFDLHTYCWRSLPEMVRAIHSARG